MLLPDLRKSFRAIGTTALEGDVEDWFGESPYSVLAFSDYAGDAAAARYEVYATYLLHWNTAQPLVDSLMTAKERHGIPSRTIDFKGRKDRKKGAALEEYLNAFANHPGVCIAICWDKRTTSFPAWRRGQRDLAADIQAKLASDVKSATAERLMRAISFLAVMGHGLRDGDRFCWVSDHDAINQGSSAVQVGPALAALARQTVPAKLEVLGHAKPLEDSHELLLTLPDLVAGSLAAGLPTPLVANELVSPLDESTRHLLGYFSQFRHGARLVVIVVEADPSNSTLRTRHITLAPWSSVVLAPPTPAVPFSPHEMVATMGGYTALGAGPGMRGWRARTPATVAQRWQEFACAVSTPLTGADLVSPRTASYRRPESGRVAPLPMSSRASAQLARAPG
jgi:hypothetical protein